MAKKAKWKKIGDSKVRHIWKCKVCRADRIVGPECYVDSGVPICTGDPRCEGNDMEYVRTEILTG